MAKIKIGIVYGGFSNESQVSKLTSQTIFNELNKNKYQVQLFDLQKDLKKFLDLALKKKINLVIPAVHGWGGEDGRLQGMLDLLQIKYIFSPYFAHAIAMNKKMTKIIAEREGLNILPDVLISKNGTISYAQIIKKLSFPIIVKPNNAGSSVGVRIAKNLTELKAGIKYGFKFDNELILEKYIKGREFTMAMHGHKDVKALPIIEIVPIISSWYDYKAKYAKNGSTHICPAKISSKIAKNIRSQGLRIFKALGCKDLARADFILDKKSGKVYFIEINTIPGMTKTSLFPQALAAKKIALNDYFDQVIKQIFKIF
jgi:D-alanine-D-alanine ligase